VFFGHPGLHHTFAFFLSSAILFPASTTTLQFATIRPVLHNPPALFSSLLSTILAESVPPHLERRASFLTFGNSQSNIVPLYPILVKVFAAICMSRAAKCLATPGGAPPSSNSCPTFGSSVAFQLCKQLHLTGTKVYARPLRPSARRTQCLMLLLTVSLALHQY
jgi:hypothetical protein